jgi:hypothetical protein
MTGMPQRGCPKPPFPRLQVVFLDQPTVGGHQSRQVTMLWEFVDDLARPFLCAGTIAETKGRHECRPVSLDQPDIQRDSCRNSDYPRRRNDARRIRRHANPIRGPGRSPIKRAPPGPYSVTWGRARPFGGGPASRRWRALSGEDPQADARPRCSVSAQ